MGMKRIAFILLFLLPMVLAAQIKPSYRQLKVYEGVYKYINNSTLKIAASPKDTTLYAIINQSCYPLKAFGTDTFKNGSGDVVLFLKDAKNAVRGYTIHKDTFALVTKKVFFPKEMWYARTDKKVYTYSTPKQLKDGLKTGSIENSGLDKALLTQMADKLIGGEYANVHSVLIIKDNKLVFEEYFYEYGRDSLHELRSATKSLVSALTGIAIQKGIIKSVEEKVLPFFPEYKIENNSAEKQSITLKNLLTNQSGLDCDISNSKSAGNETEMDYSDDWVQFTLNLPMAEAPGGKGMYCSGNPVTVGRIIEKASGMTLPDFARQHLFVPLGISSYKWNFKPAKENAEDFCQVYLKPRDMAKFGLMYLNGGKWNGNQVVPKDWVTDSFSKHSVIQGVEYGYLWWLKYLEVNGTRYYSKGAQGNGGQRICVYPEQNMVVVITGGNYNSQSPADELMAKYILPAFNKK